ncbi:MAG: TonB-dependent receptor [Flavobacteriales bacterium]|nr:TonB-dependent receptor [Flavobacteriales bacterium]
MYKINILVLLFISCFSLHAQQTEGVIYELDEQSKEIPIMGANVFWLDTSVGTITNERGYFTLPQSDKTHLLVISFVGYKVDTLHVHHNEYIKHRLQPNEELDEVTVTATQKSLQKSYLQTIGIEKISSKELLKAACCNLSESFETNPSIDVNFSDAVTGNKQIKMLGLTSPYILITEENIPSLRGASQAYGMNFTPGTWLESIQITKGAGSVINGYESISGQINTELIKPLNDIPFYLNAYGSTGSRYELNTHFNKKFSEKWSSSLFVHGSTRMNETDNNGDGFMDNPLGRQINLLNRWQYYDAKTGWVSFINVRYLGDAKMSGQLGFDPKKHKLQNQVWGAEVNTRRTDFSTKIGYVFPDLPYKSFGWQTAYSDHNQESYYGLRRYDIQQQSIYSNLMYNSIIRNTNNKFTAGINVTTDAYDEQFVTVNYDRRDSSIGAFFEYAYCNDDNFSATLGGRIDNHNRLGLFFTPRLHLRYQPWKNTTVRISGGRGKRQANIFAENQALLASSREFFLMGNNTSQPYGLNPETAWNYGVSFMQRFKLWGAEAELGLDFFVTDFVNRVVVDRYTSAGSVVFYNVEGGSTAQSTQLDFSIEPIRHFTIRTSYKYYDSQTDFLIGKKQEPLQAQHRFFTNLEFKTHIKEKGKQWRFDYTFHWNGEQYLPYTGSNPTVYQLDQKSKSFALMNAQITRTFSTVFEMYLGGENISNYRQSNAIVSANDPFSPYFDATMIYGPVFGQMYYMGLRYKIK